MKRVVVGLLLLFVVSCDRMEDLNPPYNYRWFVTNATTQDIVVWTNVNEVSIMDGEPFADDTYYSIPSGERYQIYGLSSENPEYNFESFQDRLNFLIITIADKSIVIKECRVDANADLCDLCDESEWGYLERIEFITDVYCITDYEWTFTITDADIAGAEQSERGFWWADVINFEVSCGVLNGGGSPYAHPSLEKNEKVGITEMWAHAVGHICKYEHRQKEIEPYLWVGHYWFAPEIILDLYDNGMTLKKISDCLTSDVVTLEDFQNRLVQNNNPYTSMIDGLFNKYFSD